MSSGTNEAVVAADDQEDLMEYLDSNALQEALEALMKLASNDPANIRT
jgi:hypothetical protein